MSRSKASFQFINAILAIKQKIPTPDLKIMGGWSYLDVSACA